LDEASKNADEECPSVELEMREADGETHQSDECPALEDDDASDDESDIEENPHLAESSTTPKKDPREAPQDFHRRLKKSIDNLDKSLRKDKTIRTSKAAANDILFLVSLRQYNDLRLKYALEKADLIQSLSTASPNVRPRIKMRISRIRPSTDAGNLVASRAGKGPYFARTVRSAAQEMLRTGKLPENRMGKGAVHASLLQVPGVQSALQRWTKGLLPVEEGGFEGRVSVVFFLGEHFLIHLLDAPSKTAKISQ
jgi:hypothetical protein